MLSKNDIERIRDEVLAEYNIPKEEKDKFKMIVVPIYAKVKNFSDDEYREIARKDAEDGLRLVTKDELMNELEEAMIINMTIMGKQSKLNEKQKEHLRKLTNGLYELTILGESGKTIYGYAGEGILNAVKNDLKVYLVTNGTDDSFESVKGKFKTLSASTEREMEFASDHEEELDLLLYLKQSMSEQGLDIDGMFKAFSNTKENNPEDITDAIDLGIDVTGLLN